MPRKTKIKSKRTSSQNRSHVMPVPPRLNVQPFSAIGLHLKMDTPNVTLKTLRAQPSSTTVIFNQHAQGGQGPADLCEYLLAAGFQCMQVHAPGQGGQGLGSFRFQAGPGLGPPPRAA